MLEKVLITLRVMIAKKNREVSLDAFLRGNCLRSLCPSLEGKKGSDTKSAKHPKGRSGFWCRTPFSRRMSNPIFIPDKALGSRVEIGVDFLETRHFDLSVDLCGLNTGVA